jgi:HSP20 family protein
MSIWNNNLLPSRMRNDKALSPFSNIDEMFDRFRREIFSPDLYSMGDEGFNPSVEVKEKGNQILVSAEIPGMKEEDINVTLRDNNLIIEGEKKNERTEEDKGYYRSECSYGSFYRAIPLHADVNPDKVEATYKNGVLKVNLNKLEESKQHAKRIEVKH